MMKLSKSEWKVISAFPETNRATLSEITRILRDQGIDWATNTIYTLLNRLAAKGAATIDKSVTPHIYELVGGKNPYAFAELSELTKNAFNGSPVRFLSTLLETKTISKKELEEMERLIREMKEK